MQTTLRKFNGPHCKPSAHFGVYEQLTRKVVLNIALATILILPTLLNVGLHETLGGPPPRIGSMALRQNSALMAIATALESTSVTSLSEEEHAVMRIEEDWELRVLDADPVLSAPQVGTVMTPFQNVDGLFVIFVLNHRFNPSYSPGGMEVQLWYRNQQLGWVTLDDNVMTHANETVTWTQRLEIYRHEEDDHDENERVRLRFKVLNGQSETWGSFGGQDTLNVSVPSTTADLSNYSSAVSAKYSGVTFASHRVATLILKTVRGYSQSGELLFEESNPVEVFAQSSH